MQTQCERLLEYLMEGGRISPLDSVQKLSIMRLASRVSDLIKQGHEVKKGWIEGENKYGKWRVREYWMDISIPPMTRYGENNEII